jgi:hypothetical protein
VSQASFPKLTRPLTAIPILDAWNPPEYGIAVVILATEVSVDSFLRDLSQIVAKSCDTSPISNQYLDVGFDRFVALGL